MLQDFEQTKSLVILKGTGDKVFCSGGDVKEFIKGPLKKTKNVIQNTLRSFDLITNFKKPYIVVMDGVTMGSSSALSIAGRYRIATERTVFSMPETEIGCFNGTGSSYFLPRIRLNIGMYIGLSGASLKAYDLKKVGLATHYVESKRLDELDKALFKCKSDDEIGKAISKHSSVPTTMQTELDAITPNIDKCFDGDTVEEIFENLHFDGSDWAMETIRAMNKLSPTALKVSHRSFTLGKKMSLHECLKMEYRVACHHFTKSDLKEGVRAMLIDKDFKPKWKPKKISEVKDDHVDRFFKPLPDEDELTFEKH